MTQIFNEESMRAIKRFDDLVSEMQAVYHEGDRSLYYRLGDELTKLYDSEAYQNALADLFKPLRQDA